MSNIPTPPSSPSSCRAIVVYQPAKLHTSIFLRRVLSSNLNIAPPTSPHLDIFTFSYTPQPSKSTTPSLFNREITQTEINNGTLVELEEFIPEHNFSFRLPPIPTPKDILLVIFEYTNLTTLIRCQRVCRYWCFLIKELLNSPSFTQTLCQIRDLNKALVLPVLFKPENLIPNPKSEIRTIIEDAFQEYAPVGLGAALSTQKFDPDNAILAFFTIQDFINSRTSLQSPYTSGNLASDWHEIKQSLFRKFKPITSFSLVHNPSTESDNEKQLEAIYDYFCKKIYDRAFDSQTMREHKRNGTALVTMLSGFAVAGLFLAAKFHHNN